MVRKDTPQRRVSDANGRKFVLAILTWSQPILLALILLATTYVSRKADQAATAAQVAADTATVAVARTDTALNQIHSLVDGTKSRLDTLVFDLLQDNAALREQLRIHGIKPTPSRISQ